MDKQKLNVRMPADLHRGLSEVAEEYGLSMNAMAVMALRNFVGYVESQRRLPGTHPAPKQGPRPVASSRVGPNDRCPCGSGKRYKRCCLGRDAA